jgi:hypothetical protein
MTRPIARGVQTRARPVPSAPERDAAPSADAAATAEEERWLACVACGGRITPPSARIEVNSAHEHAFVNPAAERFVVRLFSIAPGCAGAGGWSTVWTWFPGHAWEVALCRGCGAHVGWCFHGATTFHGLIRERIALEP